MNRNMIRKLADSKEKAVVLLDSEKNAAERERIRRSGKKAEYRTQQLNSLPIECIAKTYKNGIPIPSIIDVENHRKDLEYRSRFRRTLQSTIAVLIVVAALSALIATLLLPVLIVSGMSMEPTLKDGDVIVILKSQNLEAGDLVSLYYNGKIMIKRIIGQPGEYINMDADGNVYVNGSRLNEAYIGSKSLGDCDIEFPYQVPDGKYFVLGDHRSISVDSRNSLIGCIPADQIIGKIFIRIWPLPEISLVE